MAEPHDDLYVRLCEPAPEPVEPGQTQNTAAKETLDNDREDLSLALLEMG